MSPCPVLTRCRHYAVLIGVWAMLCLPNLGGPSLWDIDEGNNAECAVEMHQSGNYIVPTFNYKLRLDKPALLYWLQATSYHFFGVRELSARLPSALASLLAVLITYELGRRLFNAAAAVLAALVLATSIAFCAAAHFANPDALLNLCTLLTLWCFWNYYTRDSGAWLIGAGAACGVGMLAKGPVALLLPMASLTLFLLWRRELRRMGDWRLLPAALTFVVIAAPWYIWVGVETKGEWLAGFFWRHNVERAVGAMENHRGPFFYYVLVLIAGLTPWSVFLGPTAWHVWKRLRSRADAASTAGQDSSAHQLLLCWMAVWFGFFTLVQTKLPNYILPAYPAVALLTASFLDDWRCGRFRLPAWMLPTSLACLALIGVGVSVGFLIAGDALPLTLSGRRLPGVQTGAWLGGAFVVGSVAAAWCWIAGRRGGVLAFVTAAGLLFGGGLALWGVKLVDRFKAPRSLVESLPADHLDREVRIGAFGYFQPSLVFYCQREVICPENPICAVEFLHTPLPVYFFVTEEMWGQLRHFAPTTFHVISHHTDLYNGREILLVSNESLK